MPINQFGFWKSKSHHQKDLEELDLMADPVDLLSPDRLDIIPRIRLARAAVSGLCNSDHTDYFSLQYLSYFAHLSANSKIVDNSGVYSLEERLVSFFETISSIRTRGFREELSRVTVLKSNPRFVLNGAHRVAACIALGKDIFTDEDVLTSKGPSNLSKSERPHAQENKHGGVDTEFHRKIGFSDDFVRGLVLDYSHLSRRTRFIFVYDNRESISDEVERQLSLEARVLDRLDLDLTRDALYRLMHEFYFAKDWWGPSHVPEMARSRSTPAKSVNQCSIFTYEPIGEAHAHAVKLNVRGHLESLGINGDLIHGSDEWWDTENTLDLVLSKPGRHFLNQVPYLAEAKLIERAASFDNAYSAYSRSAERVITGSSILELYGLRREGHIEHIARTLEPKTPDWVNQGQGHPRAQLISLDEALHHPEYQFRVSGIKFQSLIAYLKTHEEGGLTNKELRDLKLAYNFLGTANETWRESVSISIRRGRWWLVVRLWRWLGNFVAWLPEFIKRPLRPLLAILKRQ